MRRATLLEARASFARAGALCGGAIVHLLRAAAVVATPPAYGVATLYGFFIFIGIGVLNVKVGVFILLLFASLPG